jgi:hypothetical protein
MKTLKIEKWGNNIFIFFPPSSPYVAQEKLEKQVIKKVWPKHYPHSVGKLPPPYDC